MPDALLHWLDMPPTIWLGCALVLALGAFVQRATGFGLAVVGAPLLLMLEPRLVPVILVLFGLTVSLMMVRHYLQEVRIGEIGMALVGRLPGNVLGLWLLLAAPMVVLEKFIAASVLFAVAVTLFRFRLPVNRASLFGAGVLSGIFGTVAAIGGPPLVLLLHGLSPDRLRGNLSAFFIVTSLMTLATLALAGQVRLWHLGLALTFLPAVLAGNALAASIAHRLDRRLLQGASLALCTLAALGLLI
ncbi:sulfite exporter TauE/SafE family protein [Billgrantia kenyensis]|uniref:Probable membrane transporter protein n=1 Tax=Billgrantia kenyensis TaxID=321266 RepID=A0A7V9W0E5_9GAMM|nr:sulfite exporter TauE/SafE family protein [Halomonas kenyensis]MBA2778647.1 sulfite exporter TauE/SafE family protein [Halomonas kenyensis]MCG6661548.1 sulfite exporter TauE/SafE family protein [Halomonas kenyensis]